MVFRILLHGAECFLEKQVDAQVMKKCHAFYETQKFITMFLRTCHQPVVSQMKIDHTFPSFSIYVYIFQVYLTFRFCIQSLYAISPLSYVLHATSITFTLIWSYTNYKVNYYWVFSSLNLNNSCGKTQGL
jgi:hypothetical protein